MTSKTGSTAMKIDTGVSHPPFIGVMFGAVFQLSAVGYCWLNFTSAQRCLQNPIDAFKTDAWSRQILITTCGALVIWIYSFLPRITHGEKTSDPSIVDKLWSIQPAVYAWHFYISNPSSRTLIMAILATIWAVRLTLNFVKKGGYSGGEDYRWVELRKWFPGWQFEVFNLIFIVFFQQLAILAFASPAAVAMQNADTPLGFIDGVASTLFLVFWFGETIADQQMFDFQTEKYRRIAAKQPLGPYSKGFIDTGLWSWSRHPNYFCEVSLWWSFWLFSVSASGVWMNFSILGPVFLTLLFFAPKASCDMTELLSGRKYSRFPEYQRRVSKFIPWWPKQEVDQDETDAKSR